ncbi:hypothetical protein ACWDKQ_34945 [Saccharopolyspora sp. NPDC000995]
MLKKLRARVLGAVLAFSALSAVGVAAPATASTSQSASSLAVSQAQPETYTIDVAGVRFTGASAREIWGACGTNSPADKLVRAFPRSGAPGAGGASNLLCGTAGFGYRHIKDRHMADWQNLAARVGSDWRSFADFAIAEILKVPEPGFPVYNKNNDTWTYRAPVQIRDSHGNVVDTYRPIVSVASGDQKIITAFPAR